jgi:dUTP pyrophosphatase
MDVCACLPDGDLSLAPGAWAAIPTGLFVEIPEGYELQVRPRSGLAAKHAVTVLNAPGTIDSDYRGELRVLLINHGPQAFGSPRAHRLATHRQPGRVPARCRWLWTYGLVLLNLAPTT